MRNVIIIALLVVIALFSCARGMAAPRVEVKEHLGRPMVFLDGVPKSLPMYSPIGFATAWYKKQIPRFGQHKMGAYFVYPPSLYGTDIFWDGDRISSEPVAQDQAKAYALIDGQAELMHSVDPDAYYIVRFSLFEPGSWRKLHQDQMFVTENGETLQCPSMASDLYWDAVVKYCIALIHCYEHRPWADRIIGYANFHRTEGTYDAAISGWVFDHSPLMTARWRAFLQAKYGTEERLRAAWHDNSLTFAAIPVPTDKLRQGAREVSRQLYWQAAAENQPLRDYLELQRDLFHQRFRQLSEAMEGAVNRHVFFLHDALKQSMLGWDIQDFFTPNQPKEFTEPELMSASGHMQVAELFDIPGCDGLITPHDYQARGVGGIFEPEGIADSAVLHGKLFFCEMDTRSYTGRRPGEQSDYGMARNLKEFAAITWRNLATSLTRGFNFYYMDLNTDWFADEQMHPIIERQVQAIKDSVNWPHETVPGIAVILDDTAVLETNGAGNYMNEAVMWELKTSLSRCGVPYRVYLLDDLKLPNFPKHRVFYFPNLFKVDDARLALLREKVFRDGNVVVWGPGPASPTARRSARSMPPGSPASPSPVGRRISRTALWSPISRIPSRAACPPIPCWAARSPMARCFSPPMAPRWPAPGPSRVSTLPAWPCSPMAKGPAVGIPAKRRWAPATMPPSSPRPSRSPPTCGATLPAMPARISIASRTTSCSPTARSSLCIPFNRAKK